MAVFANRHAFLVRCGLLGCSLLAPLAGCRNEKKDPNTSAQPAKTPVQPFVAISDAASASGTSERTDAPPPPPRPTFSRGEVLELILDPEIAGLSPEQVSERFAKLGLQRTEPLPDNIELRASTATDHLKIGYLPAENGQLRFTYLRLDALATDQAQAQAIYQELGAITSKKLGKPRWIKDLPPYLARGFKMAELDVHVGAILNADEGRPYAALAMVRPDAP